MFRYADHHIKHMNSKSYLTYNLSQELSQQQSTTATPITSHPTFIQILTLLPFDLLKHLIENPQFDALGADQQRFAFAKKIIASRRKRSLAAIQASKPNLTAKEAAALVPGENVVLSFGGGAGSSVHVTKKAPTRNLWKVEKVL